LENVEFAQARLIGFMNTVKKCREEIEVLNLQLERLDASLSSIGNAKSNIELAGRLTKGSAK